MGFPVPESPHRSLLLSITWFIAMTSLAPSCGHVSLLTQSIQMPSYVSAETFNTLRSCQVGKKLVCGLCLVRMG